MSKKISIASDLRWVLFSPKSFFKDRFLALSSKTIYALGFFGVLSGIIIGNLFTYLFSLLLLKDFSSNKEQYQALLEMLSISSDDFLVLITAQKTYSILLICCSPLIAYAAPHILGGALFFLLRLSWPTKIKLSDVLECVSVSLAAVLFYALPILGSFIALIMVGLNLSRSLTARYKLTGFVKWLSIFSALYVSIFLSSISFQLLSQTL